MSLLSLSISLEDLDVQERRYCPISCHPRVPVSRVQQSGMHLLDLRHLLLCNGARWMRHAHVASGVAESAHAVEPWRGVRGGQPPKRSAQLSG